MASDSKLYIGSTDVSRITPKISIDIDEIADAVANKLKDRTNQKEDV